jgi:hypothetical protein
MALSSIAGILFFSGVYLAFVNGRGGVGHLQGLLVVFASFFLALGIYLQSSLLLQDFNAELVGGFCFATAGTLILSAVLLYLLHVDTVHVEARKDG